MAIRELKAYPNMGLTTYLTLSNFNSVTGEWKDLLKNLTLNAVGSPTNITQDEYYTKLLKLNKETGLIGDLNKDKFDTSSGFVISFPCKVNDLVTNVDDEASIFSINSSSPYNVTEVGLGISVLKKTYTTKGTLCLKLDYTDSNILPTSVIRPSLSNKSIIVTRNDLLPCKPFSVIFKVVNNKAYLYINGILVKPGADGVSIFNNQNGALGQDGGYNLLFQRDNFTKITVGYNEQTATHRRCNFSIGEMVMYNQVLDDDTIDAMAYTSLYNLGRVFTSDCCYPLKHISEGVTLFGLVETFNPTNIDSSGNYSGDKLTDIKRKVELFSNARPNGNVASVGNDVLSLVTESNSKYRYLYMFRRYDSVVTNMNSVLNKSIIIPVNEFVQDSESVTFSLRVRITQEDLDKYNIGTNYTSLKVPIFSVLTTGLERVCGMGIYLDSTVTNTNNKYINKFVICGDDADTSVLDSNGMPNSNTNNNVEIPSNVNLDFLKGEEAYFHIRISGNDIYFGVNEQYYLSRTLTTEREMGAIGYIGIGVCPGMNGIFIGEVRQMLTYNRYLAMEEIIRNYKGVGTVGDLTADAIRINKTDIAANRKDIDRILADGAGTPIRVIDKTAPVDTIPNGTIVLKRFRD